MVLLPPVSLLPLMPPVYADHALGRCGHEAGHFRNEPPASLRVRQPRRALVELRRSVGAWFGRSAVDRAPGEGCAGNALPAFACRIVAPGMIRPVKRRLHHTAIIQEVLMRFAYH